MNTEAQISKCGNLDGMDTEMIADRRYPRVRDKPPPKPSPVKNLEEGVDPETGGQLTRKPAIREGDYLPPTNDDP